MCYKYRIESSPLLAPTPARANLAIEPQQASSRSCPAEIPMDQIKAPDLASPRFKANPYAFYARLRAEAPVFPYFNPLPIRRKVWLVTRYDDVLTVLKDGRFANDWSARMPWFLR